MSFGLVEAAIRIKGHYSVYNKTTATTAKATIAKIDFRIFHRNHLSRKFMNMESIVFVSSNKLFFDYYNFKRSEIEYPRVLDVMLSKIASIQEQYDSFEMHISLFSFNMTALNKHKDFIQAFSSHSSMFDQKLRHVHIYYTPTIIDSVMKIISKLFRKTAPRPRVVLHSKSESENELQALFARSSSPQNCEMERAEMV
jgi:hypothetical protein